jgi:hypothetical protein
MRNSKRLLVIVHFGWNGRRCYGIGICSEGYGLKPHLFLQPELTQFLLGFNHEVVAIGVDDRSIRLRLTLYSLFHSFVALPWGVLIFHEIGLLAVGNRGQKIWGYEADVIEGYEIVGDKLNLTFMDAPPVSLNMQGAESYRPCRLINAPHAVAHV